MDDLISRKAAIEYLMTNINWCDEDGYQIDDADEKRTHIENMINGIPSVPSLDKLCEWLAAENVMIPCRACNHFDNGQYMGSIAHSLLVLASTCVEDGCVQLRTKMRWGE